VGGAVGGGLALLLLVLLVAWVLRRRRRKTAPAEAPTASQVRSEYAVLPVQQAPPDKQYATGRLAV